MKAKTKIGKSLNLAEIGNFWDAELAMCKFVADEKAKPENIKDVSTLRKEWLDANGCVGANRPACLNFFCDYRSQIQKHERSCQNCPGKLTDRKFQCCASGCSWDHAAVRYYNRLVELNEKRKSHESKKLRGLNPDEMIAPCGNGVTTEKHCKNFCRCADRKTYPACTQESYPREAYVKLAEKWITENCIKRIRKDGRGTYGLKHVPEKTDSTFYCANSEFIQAALNLGYLIQSIDYPIHVCMNIVTRNEAAGRSQR